MGKKIMVLGATGMVGNLVLQECLASSEVASIICITRNTTGVEHPKLHEIIHNDFTNFSGITAHFQNIDIAYFCIGVYIGEVSRDEFIKITVEYTTAFAQVLKTESPDATFCYLSDQSADPTEKSHLLYARCKGAAENLLSALQFNALYIFRPGYIYPVNPRNKPNLSQRISRKIYPILRLLMPNGVITSERLAKVMFNIGMYGTQKSVLENSDLREVAEIIENGSSLRNNE